MAGEKSTLTRRSFLKATALTAGAAAAVGAAGCTTVAEQSEESAQQASGEKIYYNSCRGGCGNVAECRLMGTVREGKLVKTMPAPVPDEAKNIRVGCIRGVSNTQKMYHPHRNLYPMKQTGERGSDNWERISWDEAFSLAADMLKKAIDERGPESVGFVHGCGASLGVLSGWQGRYGTNEGMRSFAPTGIGPERFFRKLGLSEMLYSADSTLSWMGFYCMSQIMPFMTSAEDMFDSKVVFLWGTNVAETGMAWPIICEAREKGVKFVCIDPQYTKTAAGCDMWVPIRVGTDGALMLAMSNYIIDNDLIDYDYLRNKSVAPLLIKEDGTYLRLSDLGMDPVDVVNPMTGESAPTDTEVVYDEKTGKFGSSFEVKDPVITGTFDANGVSVRTVYDAVVENIKPFTIEFAAEECGLPLEQVQELCELYAKNKPAKIVSWCGFEHVENSWRLYLDAPFLASISGNACIPGGGYVGGYTPAGSIMKKPVNLNLESIQELEAPHTGFTLEYLPQVLETGQWAGEDFPMSGLFIASDATLSGRMGTKELIDAFNKLDFVIVSDPFMTYTAKYADLVLPISLSWEDEDFNRAFMMQKAVEPMGECKSDFEVYKGIAEAMGYDDLFPKTGQEYLREVLDTPENIEAGVAYDDYAEQGVILGEYTENVITSTEANSTGRTQFFLEYLEPNNDFGQVFELADRIPNYVHAAQAYKDNPLREKYPLFCMSAHSIYFGHTQTSHCPWLDEVRGYEGEPFIRIHEKAAAERGIVTGDTVKVFNDQGYLVAKAVLTTGVREDTIFLPRGFETDQYIEGHPQDLIPIILDPVTANDNYDDVLCQVEKF